MGTYGLQGVIRAWELGKISSEQAIGQILLLLVDLHDRLTELERDKTKNLNTRSPLTGDKSDSS